MPSHLETLTELMQPPGPERGWCKNPKLSMSSTSGGSRSHRVDREEQCDGMFLEVYAEYYRSSGRQLMLRAYM